jgi:hypothetical protein
MKRIRTIVELFAVFFALLFLLPAAGGAEEGGDFTFGDLFVTRSSTEKVRFHGYAAFQYFDAEGGGPGGNRTFDQHVFEPFFGYQVADKVFAKIILEFEHAPEEVDDDQFAELFIEQAEIDITPWQGTTFAFGAVLVPFGLENYLHSPSDNRLITRPPVVKSGPNGNPILNNTWTDVGIQVTHDLPRVGVIDLYTVNGSAVQGKGSRGRDTKGANANTGKSYGAEIQVTKLYPGLNVGASYVTGPHDPDSELDSTRMGVHVLLNMGMIYLQGEYVMGTDEGLGTVDTDRDVSGYYALVSFAPPLALLENRLDLNVRYTDWTADKDAENDFTETAVGLRYRAYQNTWAKVEYQMNKEKGSNTEVDNNVAALQLSVLF